MSTLISTTYDTGSTSTPVWVLEHMLSDRRLHLQVGHDLQVTVFPIRDHVHELLACGLRLPAGVAMELAPAGGDADPAVAPRRPLRGRVTRIDAVSAPHRRVGRDRWEPIGGRLGVRAVDSTCAPDPARSVWIPSGEPVLLGFLLHLT